MAFRPVFATLAWAVPLLLLRYVLFATILLREILRFGAVADVERVSDSVKILYIPLDSKGINHLKCIAITHNILHHG